MKQERAVPGRFLLTERDRRKIAAALYREALRIMEEAKERGRIHAYWNCCCRGGPPAK